MPRRMSSKRGILGGILFIILSLTWTTPVLPWANKTHYLINEAALAKLPEDFPSFLKQEKPWIIYLGPEPDRWRAPDAYTLKKDADPDHYIDLDKIEKSDIRRDRFRYMKAIQRRNLDLDGVGFLPFAIIETYEKLLVSFKEYRRNHSPEKKKSIERNIAYYAGLLGHFAGDGSMPLHLTKNYDGWIGPNPNGYATSEIHGPVESYADTILGLDGLLPLIKSPRILDNPFDAVIEYLYSSSTKIEELYQLHKEGAFKENPLNPKGKEFIYGSVSRGSQMLLDLWYTAYIKSKDQ